MLLIDEGHSVVALGAARALRDARYAAHLHASGVLHLFLAGLPALDPAAPRIDPDSLLPRVLRAPLELALAVFDPEPQMASVKQDLITSEGVLACVTNLMGRLSSACEKSGNLPMGVLLFVTRVEGKRLDTPQTLIILHTALSDPEAFLARTYQRAIKDHHATGVVTFGPTMSVMVERPVDIGNWRGRDFREHPHAFEALMCLLEHRTFGVRSWTARVSRDGERTMVGSFEDQHQVHRPDTGFLEFLRSTS